MKQDTLHWQWVTYQNYHDLGCTDDDLGCILVERNYTNGETKKRILSHDDEFDEFFATYNINPTMKEGKFEVSELSLLLEETKC